MANGKKRKNNKRKQKRQTRRVTQRSLSRASRQPELVVPDRRIFAIPKKIGF